MSMQALFISMYGYVQAKDILKKLDRREILHLAAVDSDSQHVCITLRACMHGA